MFNPFKKCLIFDSAEIETFLRFNYIIAAFFQCSLLNNGPIKYLYKTAPNRTCTRFIRKKRRETALDDFALGSWMDDNYRMLNKEQILGNLVKTTDVTECLLWDEQIVKQGTRCKYCSLLNSLNALLVT